MIACGSMVLAFFVPLFLICCWVSWVLILKTLWMCISKCLGSSSSTLHGSMPDVLLTLITGQQLESFYDKLLFAIWPFVGPLFFIYAKCTKDQEKLNKFYRLYMWEICLESSIQMMLQWHVIANYREAVEGSSQIPLIAIEYNQLTWAITSGILSMASVANGVRLCVKAIREESSGCWGYLKLFGCSLVTVLIWSVEIYLLESANQTWHFLANQAFNITLVPTTSTTIMQ